MIRKVFQPRLVNGTTGDPALFVDLDQHRRALLFDLGDLAALPPRDLLRVSDIFVSHCHMDHFVGFDAFLRLNVGREKTVRLFGPPEFIDRVEARLAGYTWNLVGNYAEDLVLVVGEVEPSGMVRRARFRCSREFRREPLESALAPDGVLVDDSSLRVSCVTLDHRIPVLGFAAQAPLQVTVLSRPLNDLGLAAGPWLKELKQAVATREPDHRPFAVRWNEAGEPRERVFRLRELKDALLQVEPGEKIAYVTDCVFSEANVRGIVALGEGADVFFMEAVFLERDRELAAARHHLTARQAGELARRAGAKRLAPFHFSARYGENRQRLAEEAQAAFSAGDELGR